MRRLSKFFKTFTPAAAGGVSYVDLVEQRGTYFGLRLEIAKDGVLCDAATMATVVDYVELLVNNTVQRKFAPDQLFKINASKGYDFTTGILDIHFAEADCSTGDGEDSSVWSMDGVSTFEIKVHWLAGAWTPSIQGYRIWHPTTVPAASARPITYVHKQFNEVAGTRFLDIDNDGRQINHIHMFTDKVDSFVYRRNDAVIIEGPKYLVDAEYEEHDYVPANDVCIVSQKMFTGRAPDMIPAAVILDGKAVKATHVLEVELSADAQFNTIVEAVGGWR
nr:major capsid protein P2 [Emcibacter nanhaiensis]